MKPATAPRPDVLLVTADGVTLGTVIDPATEAAAALAALDREVAA